MDEYAITTQNLTKKYKSMPVVDNVSMNVKKGEIYGFIGKNGAGKTTSIKMLSSLIMPTSGEIIIDNKNIKDNRTEIKQIINLSPQETAIAPNLTVLENLRFMAGVYGIKNKKEKINKLIDDFNLEEVKNQKSKTLSGGWQRRLSIALALINEPKILFLDEPTLGLDVIARRELWKIIRKLKGKITIILTTHYMEEAEQLSDRIGIMSKGSLLCIGTPNELIKRAETNNFEDAFVKLAMGDYME